MGLLGWITLLPLLGAILVMVVPREEEAIHRGLGLFATVATFLASFLILSGFDSATPGFQMKVDLPWVESLGIRFTLGIDGISLWLVMLTTFIVPLTLLFPQSIGLRNIRVREFTIAVLVLETGMLGAFLALDMFVFYVFWELMLVPMYFIIGIWGGERRLYASIKFVLYTLVGSLLMLAAILYMYMQAHELLVAQKAAGGEMMASLPVWTFSYEVFSHLSLPFLPQMLCFGAFALAFMIKVPLFPFHTWLPDAHVEAPTGGSVILAAVLLKFGAYGFLRFAMPMFPLATYQTAPLIAWLAVIGIIFGALMAYVQNDVKKLVAYSSVSHLGFVVIGLLTLNAQGIQGGLYQMLAHGISTGGLFLGVGILYDRRHSRKLEDFGGLWAKMPVFAVCFLVIVLASGGLPGLCGFVGEFLILLGTFRAEQGWTANGFPHGTMFWNPILMAALSATAVILAAMYLLMMYQKIMFGPLDKPENRADNMKDIHGREKFVFAVIVAAAIIMGVMPGPILSRTEASVNAFMSTFTDRLKDSTRDPQAGPHFYPPYYGDREVAAAPAGTAPVANAEVAR
jgi:NADH-quinone oxidoreductase subunit M